MDLLPGIPTIYDVACWTAAVTHIRENFSGKRIPTSSGEKDSHTVIECKSLKQLYGFITWYFYHSWGMLYLVSSSMSLCLWGGREVSNPHQVLVCSSGEQQGSQSSVISLPNYHGQPRLLDFKSVSSWCLKANFSSPNSPTISVTFSIQYINTIPL